MKPAPFEYIRADNAQEALELLHQHGDNARILAGGQSLMPALNMRLAQPGVLIDISRVQDLSYIGVENGAMRVGAAVTQNELQSAVTAHDGLTLLAQALPHLGHFQTRNRGTVCGSIAHADPSAELPLCLATLGGSVNLRSLRRRRKVPAAAFFRGALSTARAADELIESVEFPLTPNTTRHDFEEVSMRHGDFAILALAALVSESKIVIGIGGVAATPWVETFPSASAADLDTALDELAWKLDARDDQHASARYRRHLVRTLGRRIINGLQR